MNRVVLSALLLLVSLIAYSQKTKKVSATYTYYAPETMSVEEAKRTALERAKIQAIADEFGTIVSQSNSTIVSNKNGESDTQFFSIGGSDVKGEWIETIGEPNFEIYFSDRQLVINASVKGKIKERNQSLISLKANILRNGFEPKYESDTFTNGDDLYLLFHAPVNGHLLVYLLDYSNDTSYCLLPYSNSSKPSFEIRSDFKYLLFSAEHAQLEDKTTVDEYTMTNTSGTTEYNEIQIIFSPNTIVKNISDQISNNTPRQLPISEFNKWKAKLLSSDDKIQIINKPITINQIL